MTQVIASALWNSQVFGPAVTVRSPEALNKERYSLLIIHGGEDISPSIYNEAPVFTDADAQPSERDKIEMALIEAAWKQDIPVLGICRGAQLLCAMLGGALYQDVRNHAGGSHGLQWTKEAPEVIRRAWSRPITNSAHHQLMIPKGGSVIATADEIRSPVKFRATGRVEALEPEPEIIFWKEVRSLGVQGHPEWDLENRIGIRKITQQLMSELF